METRELEIQGLSLEYTDFDMGLHETVTNSTQSSYILKTPPLKFIHV